MPTIRRRPAGVSVVAGVVAVNGLASLGEAATLLGGALAPPGGVTSLWFDAFLQAIVGIALLHRAYGIWVLRPGAWLITVVLLGVRLVLILLSLMAEPTGSSRWIDVVIVALSLVYLTQPRVRRLYL